MSGHSYVITELKEGFMKRNVQTWSVGLILTLTVALFSIQKVSAHNANPSPAELITADSSFITTWKTDNPGVSDSTSITIPVHPTADYNYDVDWDNDGVFDEFGLDTAVTHNFGTPGTYTIRIRGDFENLFFRYADDKEKLIDVVQWGNIQWKTLYRGFQGCVNLNISATDTPNLSNVASLEGTFRGCTAFNSPIEHWDVSNVENFYYTLSNCPNFNQPLNNWDVSNATNMNRLFEGSTSFNQPLDQWDVSNVANFGAMFSNCEHFNQDIGNWDMGSALHTSMMFLKAYAFNQDIGDWNMSNVINMFGMFSRAHAFNQDIGDWDVSSAIRMDGMFRNASVFNQDIGNWNVGNATRMEWMFASANQFNQDIGNWNVSQVTNMNYMFFYASSFNQDIGNWDVGQVTRMQNMFKGENMAFNQDIGNWDVSQVTDFNSMFEANLAFDQNLSNWDVSNAQSMTRMFNLAQLSTPNYDSLLIGWNALELQDSVEFHGGYSIYCAGWAARENMINADGWLIQDGGSENDAPIALCKDTTLQLDASGTLTIDASLIDNDSYDLCTYVDLAASQITFDCNDIGALSDTLTVFDQNGNENFCIANITIEDTPFILNCPADVTVNANIANCSANVNWSVPQSFCTTTITASHNSGEIFPIGTTTVTYTAVDGLMNTSTCSFTVTVINDLTADVENVINPSCIDDPSGQALLAVTGGQSPYTFDWDYDGIGDGDDLEDQTGLEVGIHQVTITDAYGCTNTTSVQLQPTDVNIVNCPSDQVLTANFTDCSAMVTWAEPAEICSGAPIVSNFSPGTIFDLGTTTVTYTATNVLGATASCSFDITVENNLDITPAAVINPTCHALANGQVDISISGGATPYNFDWAHDGTGDWDDAEDLSDLPAGNYQLQVVDALGCTGTSSIQITEPDALIGEIELTHPSCGDLNDGQITVATTGGTAPYVFDWHQDGSGDFNDASNQSNLAGGQYVLDIQDAAGCRSSDTLVLYQPEPLSLSAAVDSLEKDSESTIDLNVEGGTPPFNFDWSHNDNGSFGDSEDISITEPGTYSITVLDANDCVSVMDIFVDAPPEEGCNQQDFNVYPNPNYGIFKIKLKSCEHPTLIEIFDALGRKHISMETIEAINLIRMDEYPSDAYFIKITADGESFIKPISLTKE